jgi:hypothetical protein
MCAIHHLKKTFNGLLLATLGAWQCNAFGLVTGDPMGLDELAERANLVFKGEVIKVETRFAQPSPNLSRPAPYTFVTYRVDQTIKGELSEKTMTLRFAGGPFNDDEFVMIDGLPLMDVGDKDVLFVADNGEDPCPLVDCSNGRFREIGGFIFNEQGQSIELTQDNQVKLGKAVNLEEVMHHKLSDAISITRYDSELAEEALDVDSFRESKPDYGFRPDPEGFLTLVDDAVRRAEARLADNGGIVRKERNLDPNEPFEDNYFSVPESYAPPDVEIAEEFQLQDDEPWPATADVGQQKPDSAKPAAAPKIANSKEIQPVYVGDDNGEENSRGIRLGIMMLFPGAGVLWYWLKRRNARRATRAK